jgi:DNA-binding MarR family transcriptional regulator
MTQESSGDSSQFLSLLPLIHKTVYNALSPKELGYTKTQFLILVTLYTCEDLTMTQVASYISSSKEQATRAVAPLVDDGLVERYVDSENRTKVHIHLTSKGLAFMEKYNTLFLNDARELMQAHLTDEELIELRKSIEVIIRLLTKIN